MTERQTISSQLFTVRVWQETDGEGQTHWRGRLQHVRSGELRHFRGWAALIPLMLDMLRRHVAVTVLVAAWLTVGALPVRAQGSVTTPPPLTVCAADALMSEWQGPVTLLYDAAQSVDDESVQVRRSAEVTVTFGGRMGGAIGDPFIYWPVVAAAGETIVDDAYTWNDGAPQRATTRYSGDISQATGMLVLDTATCALQMELQVHFLGAHDSSTEGASIQPGWHAFRSAWYDVADQGVFAGAATAVAAFEPDFEHDQFGVDDGPIPNALRGLALKQGAQDLGTAAVAWELRASTVMPHIVEVRFEQRRVPTGEWVTLPGNRTTDGNPVRITVAVANPTRAMLETTLRLLEAETMTPLPNGIFKSPLRAGMTHTIELVWDTQGWAWTDPACPDCTFTAHSDHRIAIQLLTKEWLFDQQEQTVTVKPKPVILVHGMASNADTWHAYPSLLQQRHPLWAAFPAPNLKTGNDLLDAQASNTLMQNARNLATYIEATRAAEQAWHVDVVAHSMGGLITREYIQTFMPAAPKVDDRPLATHLVMLGTPNRGSVCAKALTLVHWLTDNPNLNAPIQLIPEVVAIFNQRVTAQRGVQFSVLAGWLFTYPCDPLHPTPSDSVVTVDSAKYVFADTGDTTSIHTAMTSNSGDFADLVLPRLAVSRNTPAQRQGAAGASGASFAHPVKGAAGDVQIAQMIEKQVAAGATLEIPVVVPATDRLGISAVAAPALALALVDPNGAVAAISDANSAAAAQPVRALSIADPAAGTWMVRVTNSGAADARAAIGVLFGANSLMVQVTPGAPQGESMPVQVALTRNGAPQLAVTWAALVIDGDGSQTPLVLHDDGQHDDQAPGDGIYGATVSGAGDGPQVLLVRAEQDGEMRATLAILSADDGPPSVTTPLFLPLVTR